LPARRHHSGLAVFAGLTGLALFGLAAFAGVAAFFCFAASDAFGVSAAFVGFVVSAGFAVGAFFAVAAALGFACSAGSSRRAGATKARSDFRDGAGGGMSLVASGAISATHFGNSRVCGTAGCGSGAASGSVFGAGLWLSGSASRHASPGFRIIFRSQPLHRAR